jgi:archaellum biogenesis ATPase FlaH
MTLRVNAINYNYYDGLEFLVFNDILPPHLGIFETIPNLIDFFGIFLNICRDGYSFCQTMTSYEFNPSEHVLTTKWLVKDLIPLNSLTLLLSQSGVGKSFLVEYLAICIQYGIDFLGYKTVKGNVLYIDQDTPTDTLKIRLRKFAYGKMTEKHLYLHSNQNYEIDNQLSLMINEKYKDVNLIVIDCLTRLMGYSDINNQKEMADLSLFKLKVLEDSLRDVSLIVVHHTSDKKSFTLDESMESQSYGSFVLGSSIINQVADNILLLYSPDRGKKVLKNLYLRPIAKRFQIETRPIKLQLIDNNREHYFKNNGFYHKEDLLKKRIIETLTKSDKIFWKVREIYENIGLYSETVIREKLREMIELKEIEYKLTRHNLHLIIAKNAMKKKEYKKQLSEMLKESGVKKVSIEELK